MKNKKILITILGFCILCLSIMLGLNIKTYMEKREKNSIKPILASQETLEPEVKKAMNNLYKITGDNKERVVYQYNPDKNYIMEDFIKENYYAFNVIDADEDGQITNIRKCNYLVNKNTNDANVYFAGGQMNALEKADSWKVKKEYEQYYYEMQPEIKKAYERIKNTVGEDYYKYEYDPELEKAGNEKYDLGEKFYVFSDYGLDENAYFSDEGDVDLAVKKENMEVYEFSIAAYPNNYILPYGDENLGLADWQIECKKTHVSYGYKICSTAEDHRMMTRDLSSTSILGARGNTVDIEAGIDWYKNECIDQHGGSCDSIGEHQAKLINNDTLYQSYGYGYGLDKNTFFERLSSGCYEGFQYARLYKNNTPVTQYVYQFGPSDGTLTAWQYGFNLTYEKYKNY